LKIPQNPYIVSKIRSGPFLVSRTGDEGFNLTLSR